MFIKPKKSLGQNFLIDRNVLDQIIDVVEITNKNILEIGPGSGNLTSFILKKNPNKLYVVEKDDELALLLQDRFANEITIINDDILKISEDKISNEKLTVFGNLPYNISTEILSKWITNLDKKIWFESLILMFQKEVADRIIALKGRERGILSVLIQVFYNVENCIDVSPENFTPPPKIQSSVIKLNRNNRKELECSKKLFKQVVKTAFNQRRKTLRNALKTYNIEKDSKVESLLSLRAEQLNVEDFIKITKHVEAIL